MMKRSAFALFVLSCVSLMGCTDESQSRTALEKAGFTEVQITGYAWFACSDDDTYHTGFRAKNPRGEVVEGVVCCGFLTKACTVRF